MVERSVARDRLGVSEGAFVPVLVARLNPEKAIDRFVEAVGLAAAQREGIEAVVIGDGPERERLEAMAERIGAPVRFAGYLQNPFATAASADVLALTSAVEALPMVLIEAASRGLPGIAMDCGGCSEIVVDGVSGFMVANGDVNSFAEALIRLVDNPDLRSAQSKAAIDHWNSRFRFDQMADGYYELLRNAAGLPASASISS
jgi:glycosyltransferase involved in cell wall biosynthesis